MGGGVVLRCFFFARLASVTLGAGPLWPTSRVAMVAFGAVSFVVGACSADMVRSYGYVWGQRSEWVVLSFHGGGGGLLLCLISFAAGLVRIASGTGWSPAVPVCGSFSGGVSGKVYGRFWVPFTDGCFRSGLSTNVRFLCCACYLCGPVRPSFWGG